MRFAYQVNAVRLLGLQVLRELDSTLFGGDVTRQRVQATGASVVFFDSTLEDFLSASSNVDFGSIGDKGLCDHQADAGAASSDYCCDVRDIEQDAGLELVVGTLG